MPARRRAPTAAQRQRWDDERQAKLADLHTLIVEQVATLTNAEQWRAWLDFATRFHTYSFGNTIAIWRQWPDATWVAGIKRWNAMGRRVRKGERGIAILAPITGRKAPVTTTTLLQPTQTPPPARRRSVRPGSRAWLTSPVPTSPRSSKPPWPRWTAARLSRPHGCYAVLRSPQCLTSPKPRETRSSRRNVPVYPLWTPPC